MVWCAMVIFQTVTMNEYLVKTQNYLDHASKRLHYDEVSTTDVLAQLHC